MIANRTLKINRPNVINIKMSIKAPVVFAWDQLDGTLTKAIIDGTQIEGTLTRVTDFRDYAIE